jgi:hypothetical protein
MRRSATDCVHNVIKKIVCLYQIISITGRVLELANTIVFSIEVTCLRNILP